MSTTFKQEDNAVLEAQLENSRTGEPFDLSGDVDFIKLLVDHPDSGDLVVNVTDAADDFAIVDAEEGRVEYQMSQTQTARTGRHRVVWRVNFDDGTRLSFPSDGFQQLELNETIDAEQDLEEIADPDATVGQLSVQSVVANDQPEVDIQSDVDHNGNDIRGAGSVSTEVAEIDGTAVDEQKQLLDTKFIEDVIEDDGEYILSFDDIGNYINYEIEFVDAQTSSSTTMFLRANNHDSPEYWYVDWSGTVQSGQTEVLVIDTDRTDFNSSATIEISNRASQRFGSFNKLKFGRGPHLNGSREGGTEEPIGDIESFQIHSTSAFDADSEKVIMQLFGISRRAEQ